MVWRRITFGGAVLFCLPLCQSWVGAESGSSKVDFNRDIRPILSDTCFHCHGPDQANREADLRLDSPTGLFAQRDQRHMVVAGDPLASELFRRVSAVDADERMPPADSGRKLSQDQIKLIRRWIESGAQWQQHWSFIPPERPSLPKLGKPNWCQTPVDFFVLARLRKEAMSPASPTDKATLLRRATLDITGLPPTPDEVEAFLADAAPDAFQRNIDRLLSSPRYGERMAMRWLDAARYADTSGYQNDGPRYMWRWRDWVIDAYNANLPFDQFTIEQIAGDMLPGATLDQRIASGFNRNHRGNAEGGIIPEEYAVEYVVDRVDTTATVWLGLTLGCARCHDHKYDPVTQKEFYRLFAYFNNVPEYGRAIKEGNSPPYIKAPTPQQREQLHKLDAKLQAAEKQWSELLTEIDQAQLAWEESRAGQQQATTWTIEEGLLARFELNGDLVESATRTSESRFKDGEPTFAMYPGKRAVASFDGRRYIEAGDIGNFGYFDKFSLVASVLPQGDGTIVSRMTHRDQADGYYVHLKDGRIQVNLVKRWLDDSIRVECAEPMVQGEWAHVVVTYDGSRTASGIRVYVNGDEQKLHVHHDFLNQTMASEEPLRIGAGHGNFRGYIADVRVYDRVLTADEAQILSAAAPVESIVKTPTQQRSRAARKKLRAYYLQNQAPQQIHNAFVELTDRRKQRAQFIETLPTAMVMQEMIRPRDTFVLQRGQYDKPGERVSPGVPSVLLHHVSDPPNNRLGLAQWLVSSGNPLTSRVAVNRYWEMYFGAGVVTTMEDFGSQGQRPSHPGLLDWLAVEFIRGDWDVKAIQRKIVTSATYQQSSKVTPEHLQRDPDNRLLARGPRFRLTAETIRDQALAVSGAIVERIGGPSVRPYQPEGLWQEIATDKQYDLSIGGDLYRRGLYTYWKRTVAPPNMMTLDAPSREACTVSRSRTNTPLQALALMNDATFVEAARLLAQRIMNESLSPKQRIEMAFRLATSRRPRSLELDVLVEGFANHYQTFQQDHESALQLVSTGRASRDESLDVPQLAAYTAIASLILNLDETLTKE